MDKQLVLHSPEGIESSIAVVKSLGHVWLFATPWTAARQASLFFTVSQSLLKLTSIKSVIHPTLLNLSCPFFSRLQSLPGSGPFLMNQIFASGGQSFGASDSVSVLLMNIHSGLVSFRMDWLDLLAGQGTLKSLLQHHSSKASILWCSAFFMIQLSHPYMTAGKIITLTIRTFVSKVNVSAF